MRRKRAKIVSNKPRRKKLTRKGEAYKQGGGRIKEKGKTTKRIRNWRTEEKEEKECEKEKNKKEKKEEEKEQTEEKCKKK